MKKLFLILLSAVLIVTMSGCNLPFLQGSNGSGSNNGTTSGDNGTSGGNTGGDDGTSGGNTSGDNGGNNGGSTGGNTENGGNNGGNTGNNGGNTGGNTEENGGNTGGDGPVIGDYYAFSDEETAKNDSFYKSYTAEEKALYYTLWQETTTVALKIDITPYELSKINEAYVDYVNNGRSDTTKIDTYRKCNLTVTVNGTDYVYEEVGIRMRGNTSRAEFCNENGEIFHFVHFRFNLSETFDGEEYQEGGWAQELYHEWTDKAVRKVRKARSFATMEKFYYKWNKNYDQTYIREVYANRMFREYGVLAPHITLTQICIKQGEQMENIGVGSLYETVDKQFIKRNFDKDNKGGDLYKCTYTNGKADLSGAWSYGIETPTQTFAYSLKTNDDRTAPDYNHHKYLLALIKAVGADKNSASFSTNLEAIVDMNYFARFEAVNYLLGNPDCIRNNSNNYYLYFTPEGKAYFIPYDYDRCLGVNVDWNPSGDGMVSAKPYTKDSCCGGVSNPLYTKTILDGGLAKYKQLYKSALDLVLDGKYFKYDNYKTVYEAYKANYDGVTAPSQKLAESCRRIRTDRLAFSESGSTNFAGTDENGSVKEYMLRKARTARAN